MIGLMCPNLEHLYIADCQRLTDASLKSLSTCKYLTVANFADCVRYVFDEAGDKNSTRRLVIRSEI